MTRRACLLFFLVAATALHAEPKRKPAFVGVQVRLAGDEKSVLITAVIKDSPADKAGIKGGDFLLEMGGLKPTDLRTAVEIIRALEPGKKVTFRVRRDGKEMDIAVTPGTMG